MINYGRYLNIESCYLLGSELFENVIIELSWKLYLLFIHKYHS